MSDIVVDSSPQHSNTPTHFLHNEDIRRQGERIDDPELRATIQITFLEEFSRRANVTDSCLVAGIDRSTVYYWLKHDPDFASAWSIAEEQANDVLRRESWRRAVDGTSEPVVSMGKLVQDEDGNPLTVQKYDTPLLIMLMRARMPEYRDSKNIDVTQTTTINTSHQLTIDTRNMSIEDLQALRAIAERMQGKTGDTKQIEQGKTGDTAT